MLASGRKLIGENSRDARLHAETLDRDAWDPGRDDICEGIASLVAVHRLREVSCLYGFTRFEPAPLVDDDLEDVGLAVEGAPLGVNNDWLPATSVSARACSSASTPNCWLPGLSGIQPGSACRPAAGRGPLGRGNQAEHRQRAMAAPICWPTAWPTC